MADEDENRDRLRSEIIKSSSFDSDVEWSLQMIKETSSSEEEVAITPAVAAGVASTSTSASASSPPPASTPAPVSTSASASAPPPTSTSSPVSTSPVEATEGGGASDGLLDQLFNEFTARRAGILAALTSEFESFYKRCDPVGEPLCLYGHHDKSWDVKWPTDGLPPDMPKPMLGINHSRDFLPTKKEWLLLVADESDIWLTDMRLYMRDQHGLDSNSRVKLVAMINGLETIRQVVENPTNQNTFIESNESNKSASKPQSPREEDSSSGGSKRARRMK